MAEDGAGLYTSGPLVRGSQAHIRAISSTADIRSILEETQDRFGRVAFAYRRANEVDVSDSIGRDMFELLLSACLDQVLIVASGDLTFGVDRVRELLEELGALTRTKTNITVSPRKPRRSTSQVFDFGVIQPPPPSRAKRKLGPNHFLATQEAKSQPSRVFSSTHADPKRWMNNHLLLQNIAKQDIYQLRIMRKPHRLVVSTVELIALLTGRGPRPFPLFSALAPVVLTDDLLTELLLLQRQMVPDHDLKRATNMLRMLNPEIVLRINTTAGLLVDWAISVVNNKDPIAAREFKHAIFSRSNSECGIDCIPISLRKNPSRRRLAPMITVNERSLSFTSEGFFKPKNPFP